MKTGISPKLVVLLGVVSVSVSPLLSKAAEAPANIIAFNRMLFALGLMFLLKPRTFVKDLGNVSRKDRWISWCSGIFLAFHFYAWIASLQYTNIANSTVLVSMHPPILLVVSYLLFREVPGRKQLFAVGLTLLGTVALAYRDLGMAKDSLFGDGLALAGAGFMVGYLLLGRSARERLTNDQYTLHTYLSCMLTLLVISLTLGTPLFSYGLREYGIFLLLAIFPTLLGHSIFNWALAYVSPTYISVSVLGEPVLASILALLFFAEPIGLNQLVGGTGILLGIFLYSRAGVGHVKAEQ